MFFAGMSPHLVSLLVLTTLTVSAWADDDEDKLIITVEVKRNNMSIPWDNKLSDKKSKEFKAVSLAVKSQLKKDLKELPSVSQIKVKSFMEKEGHTFCEFECRVNSKHVTKEDIEKALNMTMDISASEGISYTQINMILNLLSLSWIDAYDDPKTPEYDNLMTSIIDALSEVFKGTDAVVDLEIVSVSEAIDGSLAVEYVALVDPEEDVQKSDLEEIFKEFTKDRSFEKMITAAEKPQLQQSQDQKDEPLVGVIVFAALIMGTVILVFLVVVLRRNWKSAKENAPEASFESYRRKKHRIPPDLGTQQSDTTSTSYRRTDSVVLEIVERPESDF